MPFWKLGYTDDMAGSDDARYQCTVHTLNVNRSDQFNDKNVKELGSIRMCRLVTLRYVMFCCFLVSLHFCCSFFYPSNIFVVPVVFVFFFLFKCLLRGGDNRYRWECRQNCKWMELKKLKKKIYIQTKNNK